MRGFSIAVAALCLFTACERAGRERLTESAEGLDAAELERLRSLGYVQ